MCPSRRSDEESQNQIEQIIMNRPENFFIRKEDNYG